MTKKHFIELADTLRNNLPENEDERCNLLNVLADFCQSQNPNFNRSRWMDYIEGKCGPNGGKR